MFTSANAAQFALSIPTVRNDFQVLAFEGTEALSRLYACLLYTSPSPRDLSTSRMPSSA